MLDIDHFKRFKDTNGHEAKDIILRELGFVLRNNICKGDIACRYGERNLWWFCSSPCCRWREHFETTCNQFRALQIRYREKLLGTLIFSVGFIEVTDYALVDDEIFTAADQALYAARRAGRDCVSSYHDLENAPK